MPGLICNPPRPTWPDSPAGRRPAVAGRAAFCTILVVLVLLHAAPLDARLWTDDSGRHTSEGEFVELRDGIVRLRDTQGRSISVRLDRLSKADQNYVQAQLSSPFVATGEDLDLPELVAKVKPSLVLVKTEGNIGSGFFVDADGTLVTNYHVIAERDKATVTLSNGLSAEVAGFLAADPGKDLALLKIEAQAETTPIALSAELPRQGERVAAFGAPRGFSGSVSDGIVGGIRRGNEVRQILLTTIGKDLYAEQGYGPDATWLQTSAAISPGNSGGPVVNMKGEVVGASTWSRDEAQNLNFAISVEDIRALIQRAGEVCRPLAALPRTRRVAQQQPTRPDGLPAALDRIELPSGTKLTEARVGIPEQWQSELFAADSPIYVSKHPNGDLQGLYTYDDGKLHGPAAILHENGELYILANYYTAQLDGQLRVWEENGQRLLFGEYTRGRKNGLFCLFEGGAPWLIQEWKSERLLGEYLVESSSETPAAVPRNGLNLEGTKNLIAASRFLDELEAEVDQIAAGIKREVSAWYREEDERARKARAAEWGPIARAQIDQRIRAHRAAEEAYHRALQRAAIRGIR